MLTTTNKKYVAASATKKEEGFFFQPKLTINQPNDIYEREADAMADKVMRMPANENTQQPFFKPAIIPIQRKCAHCEEKEKLQRKETNSEAMVADSATESYISSLNGKGKSLTHEERSFFEPRFGYDFSEVRLHINADANQSAKSVNALAYTNGNKIVFGAGQYNSDTDTGKQLLGHELTHVVQQNSSGNLIQKACGSDQIGTPLECSSPIDFAPESPKYLFNQNCDSFLGDNQLDLEIDVQNFADGDTIEIHGMASEEGDALYNLNLSCARAVRARETIIGIANVNNIHLNIILYAHGEIPGSNRNANRSIAIRRYTHQNIIEEPELEPQPIQEPQLQDECGNLDFFFRNILLIDPNLISDAQSCLCFGLGIADLIPVPGIGTNPVVEGADCICNIFAIIQEIYKRGTSDNRGEGCFSWSNYTLSDVGALSLLGGTTYVDCASLPIGAILGTWIGGLIGLAGGVTAGAGAGSVAGPPGAAAGGVIGGAGGTVEGAAVGIAITDMLVDLLAMGLQNYITQGTVLPISQLNACGRLIERLGTVIPNYGEPGVRSPDGTWLDENGRMHFGPGPKI